MQGGDCGGVGAGGRGEGAREGDVREGRKMDGVALCGASLGAPQSPRPAHSRVRTAEASTGGALLGARPGESGRPPPPLHQCFWPAHPFPGRDSPPRSPTGKLSPAGGDGILVEGCLRGWSWSDPCLAASLRHHLPKPEAPGLALPFCPSWGCGQWEGGALRDPGRAGWGRAARSRAELTSACCVHRAESERERSESGLVAPAPQSEVGVMLGWEPPPPPRAGSAGCGPCRITSPCPPPGFPSLRLQAPRGDPTPSWTTPLTQSPRLRTDSPVPPPG